MQRDGLTLLRLQWLNCGIPFLVERVEYVLDGHALCRLRGLIARCAALSRHHLGYEACIAQLFYEPLYETHGDFKPDGNLAHAKRFLFLAESLHQEMEEPESEHFRRGMVDSGINTLETVSLIVLIRIGDFKAQEHDHPARLQPPEEQGEGGETSVDGAVTCHTNLKPYVDALNDLKKRAGHYSTEETGPKGNPVLGMRTQSRVKSAHMTMYRDRFKRKRITGPKVPRVEVSWMRSFTLSATRMEALVEMATSTGAMTMRVM
jgi:hypothetical protein